MPYSSHTFTILPNGYNIMWQRVILHYLKDPTGSCGLLDYSGGIYLMIKLHVWIFFWSWAWWFITTFKEEKYLAAVCIQRSTLRRHLVHFGSYGGWAWSKSCFLRGYLKGEYIMCVEGTFLWLLWMCVFKMSLNIFF